MYWPQAHNNIVQFFLKQSKKSVEVIFVVGNHDEFLRECVAICQDTDGEDNIDAKSGRQDCAVEIREHFGVEE